jgi:hypothetical protein
LASGLLRQSYDEPIEVPAEMKRSLASIGTIGALLLQGCASAPSSSVPLTAELPAPAHQHVTFDAPNFERMAHATELAVETNAPPAEGHPLTSVVVTQCNLIVAVYVTMPDGRLLRFDSGAKVPAEQLLAMAYTATRSERVEVSCQESGVVGYETHAPL